MKSIYFSDYFNSIYDGYAYNQKPRTAEEYLASICKICDYLKKDFLEITSSEAEEYYEHLLHEESAGKINKRTIKARFVAYNQLAKFIEKGYPDAITYNAFEDIILPITNEEFKLQRIPTFEELDALLTAAKTDEQTFLILCLLIRVGLSARQIIVLNKESIIKVGDDLAIITKIKEKEHIMILPDDLQKKVSEYTAISSDGFFFHNKWGNRLTERNLDAILKKYAKEAGIEKNLSVKDLRNRAILEMFHAGASAKDIEEYTGLHTLRVNQFAEAANIIKECPPNLVNFRII